MCVCLCNKNIKFVNIQYMYYEREHFLFSSASLSIAGVFDGSKARSRERHSLRYRLWHRVGESVSCEITVLLLAFV